MGYKSKTNDVAGNNVFGNVNAGYNLFLLLLGLLLLLL